MQKTYEAPRLTTVGSVKDLTLGHGFSGWEDNFVLHTPWGNINIPLPGKLS